MIRPLYEPKALSPHTWLSAAVNASQDSFSVYDSTVFPDPPFYAVIVDGANTETVLVRAKGPGALSSITRGVEGTARQHSVDIPIARNFTAADHSDMIENLRYLFASHAIGVEWDRAAADTTQLKWIDLDGGEIAETPFSSFDSHLTIGAIGRVLVSPTGAVTEGTNNRGDTLTIDGSAGRVMVRIPKFYYRYEHVGTKHRWWISPFPTSGFTVHPAFVQGGIERDWIFVGAYEASPTFADYPLHADSRVVLNARSGAQPLIAPYQTGPGGAVKVPFDTGSRAPTLGDDIASTGANTGVLADYVKTGGTWAGGDATGYLLIEGNLTTGYVVGNNISDETGVFAKVKTGGAAFLTSTANVSRGYAQTIGPGWSIMNVWTWAAIRLLMLVEYKDFDFQANLGRGVVDMTSLGNGIFSGKKCGADLMDISPQMGANGTGQGSGTSGQTPIAWRGIENPYGNVTEFIDGIETNEAEWRVLRHDGLGAIYTPLAFGAYEASEAADPLSTTNDPPEASGTISEFVDEAMARGLFLPAATVADVAAYTRDKCYVRVDTGSNGVHAGGMWDDGNAAGPFMLNLNRALNAADMWFGGSRLEYIGPNPGTTTAQVGGVTISTPYPAADAFAVPITTLPGPAAPRVTEQLAVWSGTLDFARQTQLERQDGGYAFTAGTAGTTKAVIAVSYGFNIPANATIKGVEVTVWRKASAKGTNHVRDGHLYLVTEIDTYSAQDKAATSTDWDTTPEAVKYGGAADLWGETLTPAIINSGNFGVAYQGIITGASVAYLDFIGISVTYEV